MAETLIPQKKGILASWRTHNNKDTMILTKNEVKEDDEYVEDESKSNLREDNELQSLDKTS